MCVCMFLCIRVGMCTYIRVYMYIYTYLYIVLQCCYFFLIFLLLTINICRVDLSWGNYQMYSFVFHDLSVCLGKIIEHVVLFPAKFSVLYFVIFFFCECHCLYEIIKFICTLVTCILFIFLTLNSFFVRCGILPYLSANDHNFTDLAVLRVYLPVRVTLVMHSFDNG